MSRREKAAVAGDMFPGEVEPTRPASPDELRRRFVKLFRDMERHRMSHDLFSDFIEMAVCAIRKQTLPPGEQADKIEARYMSIVKRNDERTVRAMPELLGIASLAISQGGCDFIGSVASDLEVLNKRVGQFFTPYTVSSMMAKMVLHDIKPLVEKHGWFSMCEPACGGGGMIMAAADAVMDEGFDPSEVMFVDATDIANNAFLMTYLQTSLRGIPAIVRQANSLWPTDQSDAAYTPAFFPFYAKHHESFDAWRTEAATHQEREPTRPEPAKPTARPSRVSKRSKPEHEHVGATQRGLFEEVA